MNTTHFNIIFHNNHWLLGSGTIVKYLYMYSCCSRCGHVGGSVSLGEEEAFRFQNGKPGLCSLLAAYRSGCRTLGSFFSSTSACVLTYFPPCDKELNLGTMSQPWLNALLYKG